MPEEPMPEEPMTPPVPPAVPPAAWPWPAYADDDGEPFDAVAFFNPYCGPPEGEDAWLADVPAAVRDEYLDNAAVPGCRAGGPGRRVHPWRSRGRRAGVRRRGAARSAGPGPALAAFARDAWDDGLAVLSDDELIGVLSAARRLASWAAALELAAVAGLGSRRAADARAAADRRLADHVGDEVAAALTLTCRAADRLVSLAAAVMRLPAVAAALAAGRIDLPKAIIFTSELAGLGDVGAAAVAALVAADAPGLTTGQLRGVLHRAVLALDPGAARKRREKAQKDARVECWTEPAGTWSLAGRDLPPAAVLAADQHIDAAARDLKNAGAGGTLEQLRARVFLALLTSRPLYTLLPGQDHGTLPGQDDRLPGQDDGLPGQDDDGGGRRGDDGDGPGNRPGADGGGGPATRTATAQRARTGTAGTAGTAMADHEGHRPAPGRARRAAAPDSRPGRADSPGPSTSPSRSPPGSAWPAAPAKPPATATSTPPPAATSHKPSPPAPAPAGA